MEFTGDHRGDVTLARPHRPPDDDGRAVQYETVATMTDPLATLEDPFDRVRLGAVHAALEGIVTVDAQQRIVMINPAALTLFRVSAEDALGSGLQRFIPARLRDAHALHVRAFDASGRDEMSMTGRGPVLGLRGDGEEIWLEASVSRVDSLGPQGRQTHFTALLRDVSTEQGLKVALATFRVQMRSIFERAPIAIWIAEGERIVFANRACARLFGTPDAHGLLGRSIYELLRPESHPLVRQQITQALAGHVDPAPVRERIVALDGHVREAEIAIAAMPDHGQTTVQMVIADVSERAAENAELEHSRRQLRQLAASLVQTREDERRHIARELHDELGQRLSALKMELASLPPAECDDTWRARASEMIDMVDQTVSAVRRIAKDLRPAMLDDLGLNAAIEALARDTERRLGVTIELQLDDIDDTLDEQASTALYRIVQESLTNVARHARASRVQIRLREQADQVYLTVHDDGVGFSGQAMGKEGTHGLLGIRERAYMLGGDLEIGADPAGGGRLTIRLPRKRLGQPPTHRAPR